MKVDVRVSTNCPTSSVKQEGNWLKVRVKAKPVGGKANEEVVALLAEYFQVPRSSVRIIHGTTGQRKKVEIIK